MDIKARIEAERAALEAARARLTEDDRAEMQAREELARIVEERREVETRVRELDLQRRLDAVRERLGEAAHVATVAIEGREDTYVIAHNEQAFQRWSRTINSAKKPDREAAARDLAKAVIQDWNGHSLGDIAAASVMVKLPGMAGPSTVGHALDKHLQVNSAQVTPIVNEAGRLAGLYASERKSGG